MKTLVCLLALVSAFLPVITQKTGLSGKKPLEMKMLCVSLFLSVGLLAFSMQDVIAAYSIGILSALVLGAIGDFILGYKNGKYFIIGAVFFSVGHIIYSLTFLVLGEFSVTDYIIPIAVITAMLTLLLFIFSKFRLKFKAKQLPLVAYGSILMLFFTCSVTRGVTAIIGKNILFGLCLVFGGALFSFSDLLIGAKLGGMGRPKILHYAVSYTYFVAQTLFALSILFHKGV